MCIRDRKKLSELSEQLMNIAKTLRRRPLQVCLTLSQWARLNQCFKKWLHEADLFGDEEFLSVIKRHGLIAFRLCMIFTATRCGKEGYGMDSQYAPKSISRLRSPSSRLASNTAACS